jgi:hypothetical protein
MRQLLTSLFAPSKASSERDELIAFHALDKLALANAATHARREPYPHTMIENFLAPSSAERLAKDIPAPGSGGKWDRYFAAGFEDKWAISDEASLPDALHRLVYEMNSSRFITFLETLTGIEHLLPDPHLEGAGLHLVPSGGVLQVHADFNYSKRLNAYRRVNVFIYLNPRWRTEWGGALELWDAPHGRAVASYAPLFNRMVVFNSRSDTFHGHPDPITSPKDEWRTSLAMYYYTAERPSDAPAEHHNTVYKGLHV